VPAGADGTLALESSFHPALVAALKEGVPPASRRWDGVRRRWLLDPAYAALVADLCGEHLGVRPKVPGGATGGAHAGAPPAEVRLVTVEYVGACKPRPSGECTASGWAGGGWALDFPEGVLRAWVEPEGAAAPAPGWGPRGRNAPATLYAVLSVPSTATDDEIKTAFRRLARVTHPDVNREPDAAERFIALQAAYEVLADPDRRRKYDAGLALEAAVREELGATSAWGSPAARSRGRASRYAPDAGYRAPLYCGLVLVEGRERLGRFVVSRVLQWEDVVVDGKLLVSSWPPGADTFERRWVRA
jgi:hypothetical protein